MIGIPAVFARFTLPLLSAALVGGAPRAASAAETISEQDATPSGCGLPVFYPSSQWT